MGLSFCYYSSINLVFWFSLFHLTLSHLASYTQPLCHDDERSALLQFKESLIIDESASVDPFDYPKVSSWNSGEENGDCCFWDGIMCNQDTGHVIRLNLTSSCLYGSINSSSSLFHLVHLEWLSLADNNFNQSKIPSRIMKLSRLSYLDLSFSVFSGQIPSEILELSNLVFLNVSHNYLAHSNWDILSVAEVLTNLKVLDLGEVNISSSIPDTLANLSSLIHLSLDNCNLQGELPTEIFRLPNLRFLSASGNPNLIIYLPEFEKNSPLEELRIASTRVSGGIPNSIGNLKSLSYLDISYCHLSGTNIFSLANLTQISYLDLSRNEFMGEELSFIGRLSSLEELDLSYNKFSGQNSLSLSWIANLTKLTRLDLSTADLVGEIPSCLLNLTQLNFLRMGGNKLTGSIPNWLMKLHKLTWLDLSSNMLTGQIPFEIKNLTQLTQLDLGLNRLDGWVSSSLFELKDLQVLDLHSNNLSGTSDLNKFVSKLTSLELLDLSSNNLSLLSEATIYTYSHKIHYIGLCSCNLNVFPNFLQKQEQLVFLDLSSNKIAGLIPRWLLNVSIDTMEYLNLSYNLLTGFDHQRPVVLPWNTGFVLDLSSNKLQGPLPVPSNFTFSYLVSKNQLIGKLPHWICKASYLYSLDLSYNNLSGVLPQCLGNFSDILMILKLQNNKFSGSIPETFTNGSRLKMIDLSHNLFQGKIPRSLANCTELEFLNLRNNQINDSFPSWLGSLPKLRILILQQNRLYGVIEEPKTDFEFSKLHIIDLSHNRFTGNLPSKYFRRWNAMKIMHASKPEYIQYPVRSYSTFSWTDSSVTLSNKGIEMKYEKLSNFLTAILLSDNKFIGEIPSSIGDLRGLHSLNISNNNLQGRIPSSLGNLSVLESLDLSNNWLSEEIPQQLAELTFLEVFDVSHNHLTGRIPVGNQFNTFENTSFDGNPGLCGKPLTKECETSEAPPKEEEVSSSAFGFGWKPVVIGYASGLIIGVVVGHFFIARKQEWFENTFGWLLKTLERKRRNRRTM